MGQTEGNVLVNHCILFPFLSRPYNCLHFHYRRVPVDTSLCMDPETGAFFGYSRFLLYFRCPVLAER